MPPKQTIIKIDDDKLKSILEKVESRLPPKPKEGMTLKEIILKSKGMINLALKRGYTYDEIAAILSEEGISVKGTTLKQYLADSTKRKRRKPDQTTTVSPSPEAAEEKSQSLTPQPATKPDTKSDTKTDTKAGTKSKSVVRGKFANIPSNDEL